MTMKRLLIAVFAILLCLSFAWATGAGRPYPATAGGVIDPTCASSLPCIEYDNNGTGPGIRGISVSGNGLAGATKNAGTSVSNGRAGLIGNDVGTGTFNSGVHGLSVRGTGVFGQSTSGIGVDGESSTSNGVLGVTGSGVASSGIGAGVSGLDSSVTGNTNVGVFGNTTLGEGVLGRSLGSGIGTRGSSVNGVGVEGDSCIDNACAHDAGRQAALFQSWQSDGIPTVEIDAHIGDFFPLKVFDDSTGPKLVLMELDDVGNLSIAGKIFTSGGCAPGCVVVRNASGRQLQAYSSAATLPSIEDFGESQLVNGQASVRLDPKFANVVDQRANYLVFVTPEGDANTLYVTEKTLGGFTVRESHAGRSTVMFSYRIVAKPFGSREARLPMVELPKLRASAPKHRAWHPGGDVPR